MDKTTAAHLLMAYEQAIAHPDVLACRNIGAPSVNIRPAK